MASWDEREQQENLDVEQRIDQLGQWESRREDWAEWEGDVPGMMDGRPGIDPAYAPQVYTWLIIGGGMLLLMIIGAILKAMTGQH